MPSLYFLVGLVVLGLPTVAAAQLRIVTYNTTPTVNDGLSTVLEAIGNESVNGIQRPIDILALQEQPSQAVETQAVVDMLNQIYGDGNYARGNVNGDGFFTQGIVYNTKTIELLSERRVGTTSFRGAPRQTLGYRFRPVGYDAMADFHIYNSHFKANNNETDAARRNVEAIAIRRDADRLGADSSVIFLGDFNLYRDSEPAFQSLIAEGNTQAFDPIDQIGRWTGNGNFRSFHTQSTTVQGGDNRAGGGMNDRFDFQLVTSSLLDGEGLSYIGLGVPDTPVVLESHSYRAFGNNGTHFRSRDISTGAGASPEILRALETASDHLPVVADYQLPARMETSTEFPSRLIVGAETVGELRVLNSASVGSAIGADELNYDVSSLSAVSISEAGLALPLSEPTLHQFVMDAGSVGRKSGTLVISNQSPQSPDRFAQETIVYSVLGHAQPSLDRFRIQDAVELDLGRIEFETEGVEVPFEFELFNGSEKTDQRAGLRLLDVQSNNTSLVIETDATTIDAGTSQTIRGRFRLEERGMTRVPLNLVTADEELPGGQTFAPLTLTLSIQTVGDLLGDFNGDGILTVHDMEELSQSIRDSNHPNAFDLNADNLVDNQDRLVWVETLANSYVGDSNLDGEFNTSDLVAVFQAGEYRDSLPGNSSWATGDWDGDTEFDTSDMVFAFQRNGFEIGPRVSVSVPENQNPLSCLLLLILVCVRERRVG